MSKKSSLVKKDMQHLADLASLKLSEEEVGKYEGQLSETLDYVENLNELKTDSVKEAHSVIDSKDVFFEDGEENKRGLSEKEVSKNAKLKNNQFVVERIL